MKKSHQKILDEMTIPPAQPSPYESRLREIAGKICGVSPMRQEERLAVLAVLRSELRRPFELLEQQACSADCGHRDCREIREELAKWKR